jgi:two-component system chemotaxis response regulator CheB
VKLLPDAFYRAHNIDALFTSLAQHGGSRAIGVILSGQLKDGTLGLTAIKHAGGVALVQSPSEAKHPEMPENAIKSDGEIDLVAPLDKLAEEISRLVGYHDLGHRHSFVGNRDSN